MTDSPAGVVERVRLAADAGLAGFSIEDFTGDREEPMYAIEPAAERVRAAVGAAPSAGGLVVGSGRRGQDHAPSRVRGMTRNSHS